MLRRGLYDLFISCLLAHLCLSALIDRRLDDGTLSSASVLFPSIGNVRGMTGLEGVILDG